MPPKKKEIIDKANKQVKAYEDDYMQGLMTEDERLYWAQKSMASSISQEEKKSFVKSKLIKQISNNYSSFYKKDLEKFLNIF